MYTVRKLYNADDGEIDIDIEHILRMRVFDYPHDRLDLLGYFYDEIPIKQGFNLELHDDTIFGEMKYLYMNIHERYGQNSYPKYDRETRTRRWEEDPDTRRAGEAETKRGSGRF